MENVSEKKLLQTSLQIFIILGLLSLFSGCCFTRSVTQFGKTETCAIDIKKAYINNNVIVFITDAQVEYGIFGKHYITVKKDNAFQYSCNYSLCLDKKIDVTEKILQGKHDYHNMYLLLPALEHYADKGYKIYMAGICHSEKDKEIYKDLQNIDLMNDLSYFVERVQRKLGPSTSINELIDKMSIDNKFLVKIVDPFGKDYLVIINSANIILVPISYDKYLNPSKSEVFWENIKYVFYPVTYVLDIVTIPIQLLTEKGCSSMGLCFGCPDWTGGGERR
jgi:hypothetical protein